MAEGITRRQAVGSGIMLAGASLLPACATNRQPQRVRNGDPPPRSIRIAHVTDFHIQHDRRAAEGVTACFHHVQSQKDRPELIIAGGDFIFDGIDVDQSQAQRQWDLWNRVSRNECAIPMQPCLGNHDAWGWNAAAGSQPGGTHPSGKQWAMDQLGMNERFHSFDLPLNSSKPSWRVIVLDSTQADPGNPQGFIGQVDEPQFDWLERTLRDTPADRNVLIVSHIPIVTATALFLGQGEINLRRDIPPYWMHTDARRLHALFRRHPNVKLCISGHIHRNDRVDFDGVTYLCNGAVCAALWNGPNETTREGYTLIDLFDDGTFGHEYVTYGWRAAGG